MDFIGPPWRERLHAFLGGCVNKTNAVPVCIGGVADHVHLLVGFRATHRLADVVREIKSASSEWVHQEIKVPAFAWQEGYGAFSVSASQLQLVKDYISNQEEHHRKKSFKEEYFEFLLKSGIQFDEKYLWKA
jgi:REP element-mobilizing transposase RayT